MRKLTEKMKPKRGKKEVQRRVKTQMSRNLAPLNGREPQNQVASGAIQSSLACVLC
jgi:hypothetical protein